MKRWFLPLLALLLLAGCSDNVPATEPSTTPSEPPGFFAPEHPLTDAVQGVYLPEQTGFHTALPVGENLLLAREGELVLTEGERMIPVLTVQMEYDKLYPMPEGVACWQSSEGQILFLNGKLREVSRLKVPANCIGTPLLTGDGTVLYYSTGMEVRTLELSTGIDRVVYESTGKEISLSDLLWDDGILRCTVATHGGSRTLLLSAQTGEVMASGSDYETLVADDGGFFFRLTDGVVPQLVFGTKDGKTGTIWDIAPDGELIPVPAQNMLLVMNTEDAGCRLDRYDLASGKRTASVFLPGVTTIWDIRPGNDGTVWFFCDAEGEPLCHWDPSKSSIEDETVYTAPFYTREDPDTEGLAALEGKAQELAGRFGIEILIGESVLEAAPGDYTFLPEHMVQVSEKYLSAVEQALSRFPQGFFAKAMEPRGGVLRLCLVRGIGGIAQEGTLDADQGIQYWADKNAVCAVILNDGIEQSLYHVLMHVIESRVFNKTAAFDTWGKLNPQGFAYDNDYLANLGRNDAQYLEGDGRYFIDSFSMSFAREDRARIFEYACMPGNEAYFQSNAMQSKLSAICSGIRNAFGLTKYEGNLIWEQYLAKQ